MQSLLMLLLLLVLLRFVLLQVMADKHGSALYLFDRDCMTCCWQLLLLLLSLRFAGDGRQARQRAVPV
jgi:hypothetical protein